MASIPKPTASRQPAPGALSSPLPASPILPLEALGGPLAAAVCAVAERTQAPLELVAHHLLALAALPAQRLIGVRLPTGRVKPVSGYFLTLVGAGEGRGAAETLCLAPVRFWQQQFAAAPQVNRLRIDLEVIPKFDVLLPARDAPQASSSKPFAVDQVFLSPFTPSLADRYAGFSRRGGLFTGVAADLLTPTRARRNEAGSLAALWDGRTFAKVAGGVASAPRLSVHLVASEGEGIALLRAPEVADSGLLGRLLAVRPASRIGVRSFNESDGAPPSELHALHVLLTALFARDATAEARTVALGARATETWLAFAHECEAAMAPGGAFAPIRPLAGHLAEHAVRLAAVVALTEDAALSELTPAMLDRGIALARYYAAEALSLAQVRLARPEANDPLAALQAWLERKYAGQEISLREIYCCGPAEMRSPAVAMRAMRHIEMLGFAERQGKGAGRSPNAGERWRIAEAAADVPHTAA